jgi:hypothetical protein
MSKDKVNGAGSTFTDIGNNKSVEMFSDSHIAMNKEITNHPMLLMQLRVDAPSGEEGEVLGTIAAYCNIKMDGVYSRERIENLYPIIVDKLRELRKIRLH